MITEQELRKEIWSEAFDAGTQKEYARKIGVHEAVLSAFMSESRRPSRNLLVAMGYEKVVTVTYRKKKAA
jgi:hypothetical protein